MNIYYSTSAKELLEFVTLVFSTTKNSI